MDPNTQGSTLNMFDGNMGYSQHTTSEEKMSQPERMTGNNPTEITPNEHPKEYSDQDTRHQNEIELPDREQEKQEKKEGYSETPDEDYIPEINGNEKYQTNYQDDEQPQPVTE